MKLKSNRLWLIVGAGVLAGGLAWAFRPQPIVVDGARAAHGPLVVTVDEEGRTRIKQRYVVSAPLAGRLLRVALRPGDAVEAGRTVVLAIEPADPELLDPRARAQAEARVKAAEAARQRSEPVIQRARTAHDYAATDLVRARGLYADTSLSHRELDDAERREAEAAAELKSAEFEGRIADYELEIARAALLGGAPAGAERGFEVRAPVSGRVLRVWQESTAVVAAGTRILEVGDPADLEIVIEALSTDAVKIPSGARVAIEHWGGAEPLPARVRVIEPAGFTKISALGVEEQRVNVIADFTGPAERRQAIGDAFRVEARIVIWENAGVLQIPVGALFREGGEWAVFVFAEGRARRRAVQIGQRNGREAEVIAGLAEGETVVIHPGDRVRDGSRVKGR